MSHGFRATDDDAAVTDLTEIAGPPEAAGLAYRVTVRTTVTIRCDDAATFERLEREACGRGRLLVYTGEAIGLGRHIWVVLAPPDERAPVRFAGKVVRIGCEPAAAIEVVVVPDNGTHAARETAVRGAEIGRIRPVPVARLRYESERELSNLRRALAKKRLHIPVDTACTPGSEIRVCVEAPQLSMPLEVTGTVHRLLSEEETPLNGRGRVMVVHVNEISACALAELDRVVRPLPSVTST